MLRSEQDRLTLARIHGVLMRHVRAGPLTGVQEAAALAGLAEVACGRVDLLAEDAGVALGFHEDQIDAALYQRATQLCITAGADIALIEGWIDEGRRRAAAVRQIPAPPPRPDSRRLNRTGPLAVSHHSWNY